MAATGFYPELVEGLPHCCTVLLVRQLADYLLCLVWQEVALIFYRI